MDNKELVKKLQRITYKILMDVDEYCKGNNIRYFLSGGSCLGAVRHKGFIPWDDDIDLMMPREDYERFLVGFSTYLPEQYKVGSLYTDPNWIRPFARVWNTQTRLQHKTFDEMEMGVFIDVFPIDGLPNNNIRRWLHYRRLQMNNIFRVRCIQNAFSEEEKYVWIKKIMRVFFYNKDSRKYAIKMDKLAKKYGFGESNYVGAVLAQHYWDKETVLYTSMSDRLFVPFQDRLFPIPVGYDEYLKALYGSYMEIPPGVEKKGYTHISNWEIEVGNV